MSRHTGGGNKSGRQLEAGRGQKRASQLEGRQCPARVKSQEELEAAAPAVPCHRGRVAVPPCGPCRLPPCRRACHAQSCHRACRAQSCRRATEPPGMMHPTAPAALLTCSKPHLGASVRTSSPLPASLAPPYRGGPSGRCWRACDAAPRSLYSCTGACMRAQLSRPSSCRARDHMHTTCQRPWTALAADSLCGRARACVTRSSRGKATGLLVCHADALRCALATPLAVLALGASACSACCLQLLNGCNSARPLCARSLGCIL